MSIVRAFRFYGVHSQLQVDRIEANHALLSPQDWARLPAASQPETRIAALRAAVVANERLLSEVSSQAVFSDDNQRRPGSEAEDFAKGRGSCPTEFDMGKVRSTLRQFVREWSAEGAQEREESFGRMLSELTKRVPVPSGSSTRPRVLIPGAGLGRLAYEVASRGYEAQGNEWSYYMLLGSSFILNREPGLQPFVIQPWVHQQSVSVS